MTDLKERLRTDLTAAMKGRDELRTATLRMVLAAVSLLEHTPEPSKADIREGLAGNLCRCTGYMKIFDAVVKAVDSRQ